MRIGITFSKERAAYLVDCLNNGKPIEPPEGGWTRNAALAAAGALYCGAFAQGPTDEVLGGSDPTGDTPDADTVDALYNTLHLAIGWFASQTQRVVDEVYDDYFEPEHGAILKPTGPMQMAVVAARGFKPKAIEESGPLPDTPNDNGVGRA